MTGLSKQFLLPITTAITASVTDASAVATSTAVQ